MFQTIVAVLTLVSQLFPLLIQIVQQVEQAFPQGGNGANKLEMVRSGLESAFKNYTEAKVTFDQTWPTLKVFIDGAVKLYNSTGQFKKGS
jgi:hypothetical protein